MSGEYLLDTNVVIALLEREPRAVERFTREHTVAISIVTLGELVYGALRSHRIEDNVKRAEAFADCCTVLACDRAVARRYGEIKQELHRKGRPIPENDLWIAATALEHQLTLATRDAHFTEIENLRIEAW